MKKISFNKGKTFYDVSENASKEEITFVLNKLNKKTWSNIVDSMNMDFLDTGLKVDTQSLNPNEYNNVTKDQFIRFDILRAYLVTAKEDLVV